MAFDYLNFQKWSQGDAVGGNNQWAYVSTDAIATIVTTGYFDSVNNITPDGVSASPLIQLNDIIWVNCADYLGYISVDDVDPSIATSQFQITVGGGAIGTANLADSAVTTAKLDDAAVTSDKLDPTTIQYVEVDMTDADWIGMYAAPFELIAAPGANKMIVVKQAVLAMTFVSAQYTLGGAVALQYDTTVHGGGPLASATVAGATVDAYAASSSVGVAGAVASGASSAKVNKSICLSNDTAAFAVGDSTWKVHIWYEVITL